MLLININTVLIASFADENNALVSYKKHCRSNIIDYWSEAKQANLLWADNIIKKVDIFPNIIPFFLAFIRLQWKKFETEGLLTIAVVLALFQVDVYAG